MIPELSRDDLEAIFRNDPHNSYAQRYAMYPLISPGMPLAGVDFIAHAQALGDDAPVRTEGKGKNKLHGQI